MAIGNPSSTASLVGLYNVDQMPTLVFQSGATINGVAVSSIVSPLGTQSIITALNTVGAGTITGASIFGKVVQRGGTQVANFTDTTDTAANIIAAIGNSAFVGQSFKFTYQNNTQFNATITGGTGVTVSSPLIIPAGSWIEYLITYTAANTITVVPIEEGQNSALPNSQFVTNTTTTTFAAGQLTGSDYVVYANTANTPGTITTRTAAQMVADIPNAGIGQTWILRIYHGGTGTLTIAGGTNVTITGTATIATTTYRDFACNITATGTPAVTLQNIGSGTA